MQVTSGRNVFHALFYCFMSAQPNVARHVLCLNVNKDHTKICKTQHFVKWLLIIIPFPNSSPSCDELFGNGIPAPDSFMCWGWCPNVSWPRLDRTNWATSPLNLNKSSFGSISSINNLYQRVIKSVPLSDIQQPWSCGCARVQKHGWVRGKHSADKKSLSLFITVQVISFSGTAQEKLFSLVILV